MRRNLALTLVTLVLLTIPSLSQAAMRDRSFELGPYAFGASFDDESNIENSGGLGFRFGWAFAAAHELEFSVDFLATEDDFDGRLDVDLTTFKVGYVFNIAPEAQIVPLLTAGIGFQNIEISEDTAFGTIFFDDETDGLIFGGGGVRFFLGPVFNIRLDGQAVAVFPDGEDNDTLLDGVFSVGVSWVMGGY